MSKTITIEMDIEDAERIIEILDYFDSSEIYRDRLYDRIREGIKESESK